MKTETKEITVSRTVYIADDGREFVDRDDCEGYEMKLLEKSIACYNDKFEKTSFETCTYVVLVTDQDVENIELVCEYFGYCAEGFDGPGLYMYYDGYSKNEHWINLDEVISHIRGGQVDA